MTHSYIKSPKSYLVRGHRIPIAIILETLVVICFYYNHINSTLLGIFFAIFAGLFIFDIILYIIKLAVTQSISSLFEEIKHVYTKKVRYGFLIYIMLEIFVIFIVDFNQTSKENYQDTDFRSSFNQSFWGDIVEVNYTNILDSLGFYVKAYTVIYVNLNASTTTDCDLQDSTGNMFCLIKGRKSAVIECYGSRWSEIKDNKIGISHCFGYDGRVDSAYHFKIVKENEKHLYKPLRHLRILPDSMQVYVFNAWQPQKLADYKGREIAIDMIDFNKIKF